MKRSKRWFAGLLSAVLILTLLPVPALAAEAHWAQSAVDTLNEIYSTSVFSTDDTPMTKGDAHTVLSSMGCTSQKLTDASDFTRSTACEVLAEVFKLPVEGTAIQYLYEKNIINGRANGDLAPDEQISKAEFAVLTYRVLNAVGGGKGSSIAALKPGTKEYFSWMYLAARGAVSFDASATVGNITEQEWSRWITELNKIDTAVQLDSEALPCPSDPTAKLAAAVQMVDTYIIKARGASTIFSDVVPGSPFSDAIFDGVMYLFDHGIVNGHGDGTYGPHDDLHRFELAMFLARLDGEACGDDVTGSISYAIKMGYMTGEAPESWNWENPAPYWTAIVTRQEAITAVMKQAKMNVDHVNVNVLERFNDRDAVSEDNEPYAAYAVSIGLVDGEPDRESNHGVVLNLGGPVSRGVIGVLIYRTLLGVDKTKMKDYQENVQNVLTPDDPPAQQTSALLSETPSLREELTLREDWRLTSDLDLKVPAGTTLIINGGGHHIYEMGGKLTNSGTGTVTFAEGTILYPAANDPDAANITAEGNWDTNKSNQLMVLRQPHGYSIQCVENTAASTKLSLTNHTSSAASVSFVAAAYDQDGKMVAVETVNAELAVSGSVDLTVSYAAGSNVRTVKAFVLSPDTMKPLREVWPENLSG